jgi:hypothetical protein
MPCVARCSSRALPSATGAVAPKLESARSRLEPGLRVGARNGRRGSRPFAYTTAASKMSNWCLSVSIRARQPIGIVNCGDVWPKSMSVTIGKHPSVRSRNHLSEFSSILVGAAHGSPGEKPTERLQDTHVLVVHEQAINSLRGRRALRRLEEEDRPQAGLTMPTVSPGRSRGARSILPSTSGPPLLPTVGRQSDVLCLA